MSVAVQRKGLQHTQTLSWHDSAYKLKERVTCKFGRTLPAMTNRHKIISHQSSTVQNTGSTTTEHHAPDDTLIKSLTSSATIGS
jgi:hypothetical protein